MRSNMISIQRQKKRAYTQHKYIYMITTTFKQQNPTESLRMQSIFKVLMHNKITYTQA